MPWSLLDRAESAVTVGCTSYPQPGYRRGRSEGSPATPWCAPGPTGSASRRPSSTAASRTCWASSPPGSIRDIFRAGTVLIDDAVLAPLPGATRLLTGAQQIPTGREPVAGTPYDFREPRPVGQLKIDHTYTDLTRDQDGRSRVRLADPGDGTTVTFWADEAYPYFEIFTGDALPDPTRRRRSLAVEPMTAPPNALVTGESLVVLEPGASWQGRWGISAGTGVDEAGESVASRRWSRAPSMRAGPRPRSQYVWGPPRRTRPTGSSGWPAAFDTGGSPRPRPAR